MTSSPGPTPTASSARCRAVVQLETAQAYGAPTAAANSFSKAATSGPCVTHPERMGRRAASASASPITGLMMGMKGRPAMLLGRLLRLQRLLGAPPRDQPAQARVQAGGGLEAEHTARLLCGSQAARHGIHFALRAVFRSQVPAHGVSQRARQIVEAGLG